MTGFSLYAAKSQTAATNATQPKVTAKQIKDITTFLNQCPPGTQADNAPEKMYGVVMVNGKPVAAVYQTGAAMLTNEAGAKVQALMEENMDAADLAETRLELIAQALGGTIVKAPLPNGEENTPAADLGLTVTVEAPKGRIMENWWQAGSAVEAQLIGQRE